MRQTTSWRWSCDGHAAQHFVVAEALHDVVEFEYDLVHYPFANRLARSRSMKSSVSRVMGIGEDDEEERGQDQSALVEERRGRRSARRGPSR